MHEPLTTFARSADGKHRSIHEVEQGARCGCTCIVCGKPVIARQGDVRNWSFAHRPGEYQRECAWAQETALHQVAKEIIEESGAIWTPDRHMQVKLEVLWNNPPSKTDTIPGGLLRFKEVKLEHRVGEIKPDVVAIGEDGRRYFIEIVVTHGLERSKQREIARKGAATIEVNLTECDRDVGRDELREILLEASDHKIWRFHPDDAAWRRRLMAKLQAEEDERARVRRIEREALHPFKNTDKEKSAPHGMRNIRFVLRSGGVVWIGTLPDGDMLISPSIEATESLLPLIEQDGGLPLPEGGWRLPPQSRASWIPMLNTLAISVSS